MGCAPQGPSTPQAEPTVVVSLIGTNDVHGQVGRLPLVAGYVDNLRARRASDGGVVLVDAGDAFQGTLESYMDEGATIISAFNAMDYDAMALGNHEFDFGPVGPRSVPADGDDPFGAIKARLQQAKFPIVCANLVAEDGKPPPWENLHRSTVVEVAGIRIGIVGLLTEAASEVIKRPNFHGLETLDPAATLEREARTLKARGAHAVVAVAHAGGQCETVDDPHDLHACDPRSEIFQIAETLPSGLVDAIVAGHRSKAVAHFVKDIPVVQSQSGLPTFSRIDLVFDRGSKQLVDRTVHRPHALCKTSATSRCDPGEYEGARVTESERVLRVIEPSLKHAGAIRSKKLGIYLAHAMGAFKRAECPMGNLFVDLMRAAEPAADGAFANGGSLRADLPGGELTFGQMHQAMPFDNQLAVVPMSGKELKRMIAINVAQNEHGILSLSGFRARVSCADGKIQVALFREDGAPVADNERLSIVTNDFMALGGDGLLASAGIDIGAAEIDSEKKVYDVLVEGLRSHGGWDPEDRTIFDPAAPRIQLPGGTFPVVCRETASSANH